MLLTLTLALIVFALMVVEAMRARRNEAHQRARGGIEPAHDVYPLMRVAYPAVFLAMFLEGALVGPPATVVFVAGVLVFVAAKFLKWWAIRSLGYAWTFRVIVVAGDPLVASGPYRYLAHPNYVAVAGELIGAALMTRALITGPIALALFGGLMLKRIRIENNAIRGRSGLL